MVLRITKILTVLLLFSSCFLTACEELYIVDCDECELIEPSTCTLKIELDNTWSSGILYDVTIYRGTLEDGVVIYNVKTYTTVYYQVPLNSEYTVTSSIQKSGNEYIAVDSTRPRVKVIEDACEDKCYWVVDNNLDLKIKYY